MGNIGPQEHKITRIILGNAPSYQALSMPLDDERQLKLRMVVPVKREDRIHALENEEGTFG